MRLKLVVEKGLKGVAKLQPVGHGKKREGKTDLAEFIINRN